MMRRTRGGGGRNGNGGTHSGGHSGNRGGRTGGGHAHGSGVPNRHQVYDSNGPDIRIRGNAYQVCEKYQALARDAHVAGDRVKAESYLQHAEHYYRIILAIQEATGEVYRARPAEGNEAGDAPEGEAVSVSSSDPAQQPQPVLDPGQQPQPDATP